MALHRQVKGDNFDLILELLPNQGGYSKRDVHGHLGVRMRKVGADDFGRYMLQATTESLSADPMAQIANQWKSKEVRFKIRENQVEVFEEMKI